MRSVCPFLPSVTVEQFVAGGGDTEVKGESEFCQPLPWPASPALLLGSAEDGALGIAEIVF